MPVEPARMLTATPLAAEMERDLLRAAIGGDGDACGRIVAGHRGELHARCDRMLGSVQAAEDAPQEALLRAWRGLRAFDGRSVGRVLDVITLRGGRVAAVDGFSTAAAFARLAGPGPPLGPPSPGSASPRRCPSDDR